MPPLTFYPHKHLKLRHKEEHERVKVFCPGIFTSFPSKRTDVARIRNEIEAARRQEQVTISFRDRVEDIMSLLSTHIPSPYRQREMRRKLIYHATLCCRTCPNWRTNEAYITTASQSLETLIPGTLPHKWPTE